MKKFKKFKKEFKEKTIEQQEKINFIFIQDSNLKDTLKICANYYLKDSENRKPINC